MSHGCVCTLLFCCAGPIPDALGALTNLAQLNLSDNQIKGKPVTFVVFVILPRLLEHVGVNWRLGFSGTQQTNFPQAG